MKHRSHIYIYITKYCKHAAVILIKEFYACLDELVSDRTDDKTNRRTIGRMIGGFDERLDE